MLFRSEGTHIGTPTRTLMYPYQKPARVFKPVTFTTEGWLIDIALLTSLTIVLGSGLLFSGTPCGGNCATSLEGWCNVLGLVGILGVVVLVVVLGLGSGWATTLA